MLRYMESTGKNEEEAIQAALRTLGLDRDEISVEVLERAKSGFLGIGSSPARIRVTYEAPDEPAPPAEEPAPPAGEAPAPAPVPEAAPVVEEEAVSPLGDRAPASSLASWPTWRWRPAPGSPWRPTAATMWSWWGRTWGP